MHGKLRVGLALVAILALTATSAVASTFYEDFDSYTEVQMHGQGGWKGWDNDPAWGAPRSTAVSVSPDYSVEIGGNADLVHEFDSVGGLWKFTAMQYVPGNATTGENFFILLNLYSDGGDKAWSVQSRARLNTNEFVSDNGYGEFKTALVRDQWVELKYIIDLDANNVKEYYNGSLLAEFPWYDTTNAAAHGAIEAIDLFGNGAPSVYYDNINLERIPEPGTVVMLLGAGLALLAVGLRRKG
ncbi:MAG: PEP-CTERM sorting domain-containing protein [Pirellulales bacterium]|nr:PEP-CTERM sorting domain-containing protein [Pirellulales bacterium]